MTTFPAFQLYLAALLGVLLLSNANARVLTCYLYNAG